MLNTEFGLDVRPVSTLSRDELYNLLHALYYQLNERVSFVKPKEPIVAQLLFDFGNIAFLLGYYPDALKDYERAKEYGFEDQLIELRIKEANRLSNLPKTVSKALTENKVQSVYFKYGCWIVGIVLTGVLIALIYKRKKRTSTDQNAL